MKRWILLCLLAVPPVAGVRAQALALARCDAMGKGVNLSNWLEAYWQTGWPAPQGYTKNFLAGIKQSGIRSVRLPVYFAGVTGETAPYAVDTSHAVFALVDSAIAWAEALDMRLIIDNHHGWPLADSAWRPSLPRMASLWGVLARRYAHLDPDRYFFELLNEPPIAIANDSLRVIYAACMDSIRAYAPGHSVVASPAFAGIGLGFHDFLPLADTNVIYTFHTYDPYPFTHQGFSWSVPFYASGATYPGSGYDFLLDISWETMADWKNTYGLPVFLGEFGVGSYADDQSRCNWMDTIGRRIRRHDLSWFYWDVQYDFRMFRSGVVSADSIIPCFAESLRLYGDSLSTQDVAEPVSPGGVSVYPNPVTSRFTCRTDAGGPTRLEVYDDTGRQVLVRLFTQETDVYTEHWGNGLYLLKIRSAGHTSVRKIIVNR